MKRNFENLRDYLDSTNQPNGKPLVAITKVYGEKQNNVTNSLELLLKLLSAEKILERWRNRPILLKPNFCRINKFGETTSLGAIDALLTILKGFSYTNIIFGDGMTLSYLKERNPKGFEQVSTQLSKIQTKFGIKFLHFDEPFDQRFLVEADGYKFYLPIWLKEIAGIINFATLKTHSQMVGSFAIKNHMGLLSGEDRIELHKKGIADGIWGLQSCLAKIVPEQIHLVDGLYSFQGYEAPNKCIKSNMFIGGFNPCAVDYVCACLMGIDVEYQFPQYTVAIQNDFAYGLKKSIEFCGESISDSKFQCFIPDQIFRIGSIFPSIRIFWGEFDYPMNQAVKDLLRALDCDLPLDIFVGGAFPKVDTDYRLSVCLGNKSISAYTDCCKRVVKIPGNPPAGTEVSKHINEIKSWFNQ